MISEDKPVRIKTLDELLDSDLKILEGPNIFDIESKKYKSAIEKRKFVNSSNGFVSFGNIQDTAAIILQCSQVNYFIDFYNLTSKFYIMKSQFNYHYTHMRASRLNKFLTRWQLIMDFCFEAGLPQIWETFERVEKYFKKIPEEREEILGFNDIFIAFYAGIFGCIFGAFALVCEIFWHDFVKEIYKRGKLRLKELKFGRRRKVRRKVKRIQVRPID